MLKKVLLVLSMSFGGMLAAMPAHAEEGDGSIYPNGAENSMAGIVPPPGNYFLPTFGYYSSGRLNDNNGKSSVPGFHVDSESIALRVVHVWDFKFLGGNLFNQVIVPFVNVNARADGESQSQFNMSNLYLTVFGDSWHMGNFHTAVGLDVDLPVTGYKEGDLANTTKNYVMFEPAVGFSWFVPNGPEISTKMMYDFNLKNPTTDYLSGQAFHADYGLMWNFGKLSVGTVGYGYLQTTDDRQYGQIVDGNGNRMSAFAIGPGLRYQLGHIQIWANWQREVVAYNHTQGNSLSLRASLSF